MGLLDHYAPQSTSVLDLAGIAGEMTTLEAVQAVVPVDQAIVDKIKAHDPDAKFAVFEVESGMSKSNRNWRPELLDKVAGVVNSAHPVAYKGHIDPKDDHSAFPAIHAMWLGAKTVPLPNGQKKLQVKCWLRTAEIREEVALGMVTGISVRGDIKYRPLPNGGMDVVDFDLESIDFTRKGRNGMPSRLLHIGSEQITGGNRVEPRDIALISEQELRTHHPLLVKKIEDDATATLNTKIGEMTTVAATVQPQIDILEEIKKLLKLSDGENAVEKVAALISKVEEAGKEAVRNFIKETAAKKVKGNLAQQLVARSVGEQIDLSATLTDEYKTQIEGKVDAAIDADDAIKEFKVEAGAGEQQSHSDDEGTERGGEMVRRPDSRGGQAGGIVKKNSRMTVKRTRLQV